MAASAQQRALGLLSPPAQPLRNSNYTGDKSKGNKKKTGGHKTCSVCARVRVCVCVRARVCVFVCYVGGGACTTATVHRYVCGRNGFCSGSVYPSVHRNASRNTIVDSFYSTYVRIRNGCNCFYFFDTDVCGQKPVLGSPFPLAAPHRPPHPTQPSFKTTTC